MIAPIFLHFAARDGGGIDPGTAIALWVGLGLALGGALIGVVIYILSGARPQAADLDSFLGSIPRVVLTSAVRKTSLERARPWRKSATEKAPTDMATKTRRVNGPVLLAYDGSALAALAIEEAGRQARHRTRRAGALRMAAGRSWLRTRQQATLRRHRGDEVRRAAEETAAYGASLANKAGLMAQGLVVEAAPIGKESSRRRKEHQGEA